MEKFVWVFKERLFCSSFLSPVLQIWGRRGEHCKVPALFWWQTWVQEMAQLKYGPSHPQQPLEGGIDYKGLRT